MIVGTAGHIDHGKTALVRALTGTDADRLPEEKRRGITIELGYAFMPAAHDAAPGAQPVGFVDVPGHEKLVRTMVAGASGIDYALLLIAADDGVMPQTLEHLTILSMLGIERGAAVVTKIDRMPPEAVRTREAEARTLLDRAGHPGWPVLAVSAQRGDGLDALRVLLEQEALHADAHRSDEAAHEGFRMGLDRVFTLDGIGTVVAGSVSAGRVGVGDLLCLAQAPGNTYRVRSLHSHNRSVESAGRGQRCAVGLVGLERSAVERGQVLCEPGIAQQAVRLDVWLQVAGSEAGPLRSGTRVHLHAGTQERMATVAVLGQPSIAPGEAGPAQLVVQQPLSAWHGDRLVLRDAAASRTLAAAAVLEADAPARYRQTPERLAYLQALRRPVPAQRLVAALAHAPFGLQGAMWLRGNGLAGWPFDVSALPGVVVVKDWIISAERLRESEAAVLAALGAFHMRLPQDVGPDLKRTRRLAAPRMPDALWAALVARLAGSQQIQVRNGFVCLASHGEQLRAADRVVAERALPLLLEGRFEPPWVRDIAADTRLPEEQVRQVMARLARTGDAFQVVKDLYYHPHAVQALAAIARGIAAQNAAGGGEITAAAFRDASGLGRKRAIQILEFFDRLGLLRRVGDSHLVRPGTQLFAEGAP